MLCTVNRTETHTAFYLRESSKENLGTETKYNHLQNIVRRILENKLTNKLTNLKWILETYKI